MVSQGSPPDQILFSADGPSLLGKQHFEVWFGTGNWAFFSGWFQIQVGSGGWGWSTTNHWVSTLDRALVY